MRLLLSQYFRHQIKDFLCQTGFSISFYRKLINCLIGKPVKKSNEESAAGACHAISLFTSSVRAGCRGGSVREERWRLVPSVYKSGEGRANSPSTAPQHVPQEPWVAAVRTRGPSPSRVCSCPAMAGLHLNLHIGNLFEVRLL